MTDTIQDPITGKEAFGDMTRAYDALVEFYAAFNAGDFGLMSKDASMSNPLGGIRRGWREIRTVYENIFNGPAEVYVEYYDYAILEGDGFFQAVGRERGTFTLGETSVDLKIRTSRTYVLHEGRYRQLHHHGSIEDPALLKAYQDSVLSASQA